MDDFDFGRFIEAQAPIYDQTLSELRAGRKRSHWMWFVFPQIAGLGHSPMAQRFAIADADEARAYLEHPLLGSRLLTCTEAMLAQSQRSAHAILGSPDDLKFGSSMTLFSTIEKKGSPFEQALLVFYDGKPDEATLARL